MQNRESKYYSDESMFHGSVARIMGTRFDMIILRLGQPEAETVWNRILNLLRDWENRLNHFDSESELAKVNSRAGNGRIQISKELAYLLNLAHSYWERTEKLFDITLGKMDCIRFSEDSIELPKGCRLDFGGFAKGYVLEEITGILKDEGVECAFIDFGGSSIAAVGSHPYGEYWPVSLEDPDTNMKIHDFALYNTALSTSGNRAGYTGHIINPLTGEANKEKIMTSIMAPSALDAEVLSTVWVIADEEQRNRIEENFNITEKHIFKNVI